MTCSMCESWPPANRTPSTPFSSGAGRHPHEVQLAIGATREIDLGDRGKAWSIEHGAAGHRTKRGPDEQLVGHKSRDRVPGQAEDRCPGFLEHPEGKGFGGLDGDLHRTHGGPAQILEHGLHQVAVTDADSSARDDGIASGSCLFEQGGRGPPHRLRPRRGRQCRSRQPAAGRAAPDGWRRGSSLAPRSPADVISSSPVERTPTVGQGWTRTCSTPMLDSTPTCAGPSDVPAEKTSSPARISLPASRMNVPGATASSTTTIEPSDSTRVCSTMHTASAPGGNGAPVMMRTDSPTEIDVFALSPAMTVSTTRRRAGGRAVSAARTAYPSMDEIRKGRHGFGGQDRLGQHMTRGVA